MIVFFCAIEIKLESDDAVCLYVRFVFHLRVNCTDDAEYPGEVIEVSRTELWKLIIIMVNDCVVKLVARLSRLIIFVY